jgi:hypothetical protein
VEFTYGSTERITPTTVVSREYQLKSQVDDDDPAGASARGRHLSTITTPAGVTRASSVVTMQATSSHFHVTIDLTVDVNGIPHHSRQWTRSVPRVLL